LAIGRAGGSKEPVRRESFDRGHGTSQAGEGGANYRTRRQDFALKEVTRLRKDLVGLGQLQCGWSDGIQIRKRGSVKVLGVGQRRRISHRITRLVVPQRKMVNLDAADAWNGV
jgi:hypothetical protein